MANSAKPITDLQTAWNNYISNLSTYLTGAYPTTASATLKNSTGGAGPVIDVPGELRSVILGLEGVEEGLKRVASVIDQTNDATNYALVNNAYQLFVSGSGATGAQQVGYS